MFQLLGVRAALEGASAELEGRDGEVEDGREAEPRPSGSPSEDSDYEPCEPLSVVAD